MFNAKSAKLIFFTAIAVLLVMTGCKSEGWQSKDAYDKVLKMYDKQEIKEQLNYKNYSDVYQNLFGETIDKRTHAEFRFGQKSSKEEQKFEIFVFKKKDNSRVTKEQIEKDLEKTQKNEKSDKNDIFVKDNILVIVPKKDIPNLEQKVYDLFMSYVQ